MEPCDSDEDYKSRKFQKMNYGMSIISALTVHLSNCEAEASKTEDLDRLDTSNANANSKCPCSRSANFKQLKPNDGSDERNLTLVVSLPRIIWHGGPRLTAFLYSDTQMLIRTFSISSMSRVNANRYFSKWRTRISAEMALLRLLSLAGRKAARSPAKRLRNEEVPRCELQKATLTPLILDMLSSSSYWHHVIEFFSALHSFSDGFALHFATILQASVSLVDRFSNPSASGSKPALLISYSPVCLRVMLPAYKP